MNFGNSIFEGFESTKDLNKVHYTLLDDKYSTLKKKYPFNKISKELIFSLYALQEGVSRLKYDDKSRGTGTIKFIKSFFDIGDYEDRTLGYIPFLNIYTGNCLIVCDNIYQPHFEDNMWKITLNGQKDLGILPDPNYLKRLDRPFPGTLIFVKIYLNEEHIESKLKKDEIDRPN